MPTITHKNFQIQKTTHKLSTIDLSDINFYFKSKNTKIGVVNIPDHIKYNLIFYITCLQNLTINDTDNGIISLDRITTSEQLFTITNTDSQQQINISFIIAKNNDYNTILNAIVKLGSNSETVDICIKGDKTKIKNKKFNEFINIVHQIFVKLVNYKN